MTLDLSKPYGMPKYQPRLKFIL